MPQHHFTTPRVVYLGLAHAEKPARTAGASSRSRAELNRRTPEHAARRRVAAVAAPATLR